MARATSAGARFVLQDGGTVVLVEDRPGVIAALREAGVCRVFIRHGEPLRRLVDWFAGEYPMHPSEIQ